MVSPDPYCDHLASPNPWAFALSIFLVAGILVSYLPQHAKIIQHATSAGLSPWWVLLGTLSSISAIANIAVLPTSQHDMACCSQISGVACGAALLGIVQIGIQWLCFMTIMVLFLIYFPRGGIDHTTPESELGPDVPRGRDAVVVGLSSLLTLLFVGIASTVFLFRAPEYLLTWANILGICASILSCIQYIPQLYTTWKCKQVLSLSITTMMIQVPGAFLFAFSLWLRVGAAGWSTWLVYCVTGCLQGLLLAMAVSFWLKERNAKAGDEAEASPTENDPLLAQRSNGHT